MTFSTSDTLISTAQSGGNVTLLETLSQRGNNNALSHTFNEISFLWDDSIGLEYIASQSIEYQLNTLT